MRRFPVFPVFGRGDYPVQPTYAEDLAAQAVKAGSESENLVADAARLDTLTFEELLRLLASAVGARVQLMHTPPYLGLALTRLVGLLMCDVVLTKDEVDGLIGGVADFGSRADRVGQSEGLAYRKRWCSRAAVRV